MQNICYHFAACVVSFNLMCNMTIFQKRLILVSVPPPKSTLEDRTKTFKLKSPLIRFVSIAALPACEISAKILTTASVFTKFYYLTFDTFDKSADGRNGWTDRGRRQNYTHLTSSMDNKQAKSNGNIRLKKERKNSHSTVHQKSKQLNKYVIYQSIYNTMFII